MNNQAKGGTKGGVVSSADVQQNAKKKLRVRKEPMKLTEADLAKIRGRSHGDHPAKV